MFIAAAEPSGLAKAKIGTALMRKGIARVGLATTSTGEGIDPQSAVVCRRGTVEKRTAQALERTDKQWKS